MTRLCHGYKEGTLPQSQVLSNDFRDYHLLSDERKILQMENKFLQTKLGIHLEFWQIDQRHLEEELLRANRICEKMEVSHAYDLAKLNCNLAWKDEEALILRLKLEKALDDLDDLQSRLNVLTTYYAIQKENSKHNAGNEEEMTAKKQIENLEKQIEDLQRKIVDTESDYKAHLEKERHEKSVIESQSKKEMSGLMRERDFVWNQLKLMENDYCSRIKLKEEQIQTARAEVENLRTALQKTKDEKDAEVVKLSSDLKQVEDMLGHVMAKSNHEKDGHSTMEHELDENACHMHSPGSVSNSDVELPEGEPEVSVENAKMDHLTKGKKKVNREDRSPDAASKLSAALKRNDDLQLENQNLKVLYAELEANYNKQKTEKVVRNSKKGSITRNLKAELEAAAASDEKENLEDNSIRKRLRSAKGGTGRKGRLAEQDEHAITARKSNSKHKMSSEKLDASEQEKLSAEHSRLVKTGFFSNAFSIPKIKCPSTSVNTFR